MNDSLAQWYQDARYVPWGEHRIAVRGHALPASCATVLIHGFPTASWDWHRIWPQLSGTGPLLTFDLLGFGYSSKPHPHQYSLMEQADLVQAMCAAHGVESIHLLAHDYGDSVAQELLARGSDAPQILSCFLLNGGIIPGEHRALPVQKLLAGPLGPLVARLMSKRRFSRNFATIFAPRSQPTEQDLEHCWKLIEHHGGRRVMANISRYQGERRAHKQRWVGALANAPVPCGALIGEQDPISGAHMADALAEHCPRITLKRLPDMGHYPQLEAPQQVFDIYLEFRQACPREN